MNAEQAFQQAISVSKKYTEESLTGAGALKGKDGKNGEGVPPGGTVGQVLVKTGDGDYETAWKDPPSGSGENDVTFFKCIL